jgi:ADP-ribose pyrophosphatase
VTTDPVLTASATRWASPRFALVEETFATVDGPATRPVIHHPGAVAILAQPDAGSILLVRQFRYPVRRWTVEIPAGTRVPGEPPAVTAARELQEEAGFAAARLEELGSFFPALGVSDERMILYRASALSRVPACPEHGELVGPLVVPLDRLPALAAAGELCDAKTLIALALIGVPVAQVLPR